MKITSLILLLVLYTAPMFAQPDEGRGQGPGSRGQMSEEDVKNRVERLTKALDCSDEQSEEILDFELDFYKNARAEREKFAGDRDAMRSFMREQRELRDKKYKEVLTEDQMKEYTRMQEERRQRQGQPVEGQRGRGRGRG